MIKRKSQISHLTIGNCNKSSVCRRWSGGGQALTLAFTAFTAFKLNPRSRRVCSFPAVNTLVTTQVFTALSKSISKLLCVCESARVLFWVASLAVIRHSANRSRFPLPAPLKGSCRSLASKLTAFSAC